MQAAVTSPLRAKRALCRESIGLAALAFAAMLAPAAAQAIVIPCHEVGGEFFPSVTRNIEVVAARVTVDMRSDTADPRLATLDAEIHLRNRTGNVLEGCLLVADDLANTAFTWTWAPQAPPTRSHMSITFRLGSHHVTHHDCHVRRQAQWVGTLHNSA